jgi:hypothetical protein
MINSNEPIRFEIAELPDLATEVALSGGAQQQEVGGAACLCVAAGIAIYAAL